MKLADYPSLKSSGDKPFLMTHIVAGYPDFDTNETLIYEMANLGVKLIEIQIPFSDPLADGGVITRANQCSLEQGTSLDDCFRLMERVSARVKLPVLFMAYSNSVHACGFERFVQRAEQSGCSGFIVPDLPYDTNDAQQFNAICNKRDLPNIQVISSNISSARLKSIAAIAQGFIYLTLRIGITGSRKTLDSTMLKYIAELYENLQLPLAAGFGISKPEHIHQLAGKLDIAVVGSKLIEIQEQDGTKAVIKFIKSLI